MKRSELINLANYVRGFNANVPQACETISAELVRSHNRALANTCRKLARLELVAERMREERNDIETELRIEQQELSERQSLS